MRRECRGPCGCLTSLTVLTEGMPPSSSTRSVVSPSSSHFASAIDVKVLEMTMF